MLARPDKSPRFLRRHLRRFTLYTNSSEYNNSLCWSLSVTQGHFVFYSRTMATSRKRGTILEGVDFLSDLETARRRKQICRVDIRKRAICSYEFGIDEDYANCLEHLQVFLDLKEEKDENENENENENDVTYMRFIENLKEHENSYVLNVSVEHGVLFPIKYEADEGPSRKLKREIPLFCSSSLIQKSGSLGLNSDMEFDTEYSGSLKEDTSIWKNPTRTRTRPSTPRSQTAEGCCKTQNDRLEKTSEAQIQISRPPTPAPSQPALIPRAPTLTSTPTLRTSIHKTLKPQGNLSRRSHSQFYKELKGICRKPYQQKEYEDLLEQVNLHKPIMVHKETRRGAYSNLGELGKSYLDNYQDLADEIKKVDSDPRKVLNLLRGFFLYLRNVPHGVPRPWRDKTCRAIMLGKA